MIDRIRKTSWLWRVVVLAGLGVASNVAAEQRGLDVPEIFESPKVERQAVLTDEVLDGIQGRYTPEWQVPRAGQVILWDERPGHDAGGNRDNAQQTSGFGNHQRSGVTTMRSR
ncbi:hypothetical protein QWY74_08290 [Halomonas almeriensis]|uniref:hypothetical protein n=1 Tax=Halomonas almeriensis TaxID=308163 RepID=UPI0025B4848A|nr:hypothetical protein [Halomonas almeriensis]MDN3553460.1 hypothetical protein [Halomonas almeriensis]